MYRAWIPKATSSPLPSASTSPATTPWIASAILSDCATLVMADGTHSSARGGGEEGAGHASRRGLGGRDVDAVSRPQLRDRPFEEQGQAGLVCGFVGRLLP